MPRLTTQTVNTYLAVLLITMVGALATHAIITASKTMTFISYDPSKELPESF